MKKQHSDVCSGLISDVLKSIDTPRALALWLCYKYDHSSFISEDWAVDTASPTFVRDYMATAYLKKFQGWKVAGHDTEQVALRSWLAAEDRCKATNSRIRAWRNSPSWGGVNEVLHLARRYVAQVLGPLSLSRLVDLHDLCRWGPGATSDLRRPEAHFENKMSFPMSTTITALPYIRSVIQSNPHWLYAALGEDYELGTKVSLLPSCFKIDNNERVVFVAKTAKTDRTIAAGATANTWLQQGVGRYIRRRLKRFGVDLDDQTINQRGAMCAHKLGLATLDLSSASDSICRELVAELLPIDWYCYLDRLRSHSCTVKGKTYHLQKFCGMGNAFCFELESMIFWALSCAVCELHGEDPLWVYVYGDDIIVPSKVAPHLIVALNDLGFELNLEKSFLAGPFYESCGKHYYEGQDVTPAYQKKVPGTAAEYIRAHNRLVRLENRLPNWCRPRFSRATWRLIDAYPFGRLPRIPLWDVGDDGYLSHPEMLQWDVSRGFRCTTLIAVSNQIDGEKVAAKECTDYALKLISFLRLNAAKTGHVVRLGKEKYRTKTRYVSFNADFEGGVPPSLSAFIVLRAHERREAYGSALEA